MDYIMDHYESQIPSEIRPPNQGPDYGGNGPAALGKFLQNEPLGKKSQIWPPYYGGPYQILKRLRGKRARSPRKSDLQIRVEITVDLA